MIIFLISFLNCIYRVRSDYVLVCALCTLSLFASSNSSCASSRWSLAITIFVFMMSSLNAITIFSLSSCLSSFVLIHAAMFMGTFSSTVSSLVSYVHIRCLYYDYEDLVFCNKSHFSFPYCSTYWRHTSSQMCNSVPLLLVFRNRTVTSVYIMWVCYRFIEGMICWLFICTSSTMSTYF